MIGQHPPRADDLIVLLSVARLGRFKAAASALGTTHTTVSRRIAELDSALGGRTLVRGVHGWELTPLGAQAFRVAEGIETGLDDLANYASDAPGLRGIVRVSAPDAFGALFVTPAVVELQRSNPDLSVELVSNTRQASLHRSGVDVEIVIGKPSIRHTLYVPLTDYFLRLYASPEYLERNGTPAELDDLRRHSFVSYIEAELQVPELGRMGAGLPQPRATFQSTGIFSQLSAVRQHAGIGLLPSFVVEEEHGLLPVLPTLFQKKPQIGAVIRVESATSPSAQGVVRALQERIAEHSATLAR